MRKYLNKSGSSGVTAYEIGKDSITVQFAGGSIYLYTKKSCGMQTITKMKRMAQTGQGLATYISQYVKDRYETQLA